jgi:hypothetical protein
LIKIEIIILSKNRKEKAKNNNKNVFENTLVINDIKLFFINKTLILEF